MCILLFQGVRISWEKVLVVYSFCADLSIRALYENFERQFERIQNWALFFLDSYITDWVKSEGGWVSHMQMDINQFIFTFLFLDLFQKVVLNKSLAFTAKVTFLSFCCLSLIVIGIYVYNNSQK